MNLPNQKDLKNLVKFLRKEGISSLKSGDFEISLSPGSLFPTKPGKPDSSSDEIETPTKYTEDDVLNWSSAGIPNPVSGAQ